MKTWKFYIPMTITPLFVALSTALISAEENSAAKGGLADQGVSIKKTRITRVTDDFPKHYRDAFDRYVQVIAPNGKPINIFAQKEITDAQIRRVREVMIHFLTDFPDSRFGTDKSIIADRMADNGASMMICKGHDGQYREPRIHAQPLYADETIVEGTDAYINNQFKNHRDASLEEILHCVHDNGIGVDFRGAPKGVLPEFQKELRSATTHAMKNGIWPTRSFQSRASGWIKELRQEGSLTQEYLASVIDSYYGLWGAFNKDFGMWGGYIARTRRDIQEKDPRGYAIAKTFFHPYLTYNAEIDSSFEGTFTMTFDKSKPYTYKSQYLLHAHLTGSNNSNLTGNDQDNMLAGNAGNNTIDGREGSDTVVFPKPRSAYTVTKHDDGSMTVVGDGIDKLVNIDKLVFDGAKLEASRFVDPVPIRSGNPDREGDGEVDKLEVFFKQIDSNSDGKIVLSEVPKANHEGFRNADANGDKVVTLAEFRAAFGGAEKQPDGEEGHDHDQLKTHLGGCVLRKPIGKVPDNLYAISDVVKTGEYAPFVKKLTACGITLVAADDVSDSFLKLVGTTIGEIFRKGPNIDEKLQQKVIKQLYLYQAVLPVISGKDLSIIEENEEAVNRLMRRSSVCDIVMANVEGQVIEVVEHILHTVTDVGLHYAFPKQWGLSESSNLYAAMQKAIKKNYYNVDQYSAEFGQDKKEVYNRIVLQEFAYWFINTQWGIHEAYGQRDDEWSIISSGELMKRLPKFYKNSKGTVGRTMSPPTKATLIKIHSLDPRHQTKRGQGKP